MSSACLRSGYVKRSAEKKKSTPSNLRQFNKNVAKVRRALKKFREVIELSVRKKTDTFAVTKAYVSGGLGDGVVWLLFKDGIFTVAPHDRIHGIDGVVGGYNLSVLKAASALEAFGVITDPERDDFDSWWRAQNSRHSQESSLSRLRALAAEHNYELKPLPSRPSRRKRRQ